MKVSFKRIPDNWVGYDEGHVVIHIKECDLTIGVRRYFEEETAKMSIEKGKYDNTNQR